MTTRAEIRAEIESVAPFDPRERATKQAVLAWVDSGAELCRIEKPDTPPEHLVAYFVLVDGEHILLVDHINAQLWLPAGGHVEPGEHPRDTALREAHEELNFSGGFLRPGPLLLTRTVTVGLTAGHTDVSLWYVLDGDRTAPIEFDASEFKDARWFHRTQVPMHRTDPEMGRFLRKFYGAGDRHVAAPVLL